MQIIERCPRTEVHAEIAFLKSAPNAVAIGHAAHIALAPFGVIHLVGVGTELQFAQHVQHPHAALHVARSGINSHGCQVVAAHVAIESVPVGIGLCPGRQPCLFQIGSQQTVHVVL